MQSHAGPKPSGDTQKQGSVAAISRPHFWQFTTSMRSGQGASNFHTRFTA